MDVSILKDLNINHIQADISVTTSLASSNKWSYPMNLAFQPTHVIINRVLYWNTGTDNTVYQLQWDVLNNRNDFACIFMEGKSNPLIGAIHAIGNSSSSTTFTVLGSSGSGVPTGGNITVDMTFIKLMDKKDK